MGITGYITTLVRAGSIPKGINSEHETFLFKIMEGYSSAYKIFCSFEKEDERCRNYRTKKGWVTKDITMSVFFLESSI
jgi:hypothetical protein